MIDLAGEITKALQDPRVGVALAQHIEPAVSRVLEQRETDGLMPSEQVALALGYKQPDGTANLNAFHAFRNRHPEFMALATKIGKRWYWRRSVFNRWLDENPRHKRDAERRAP